MAEDLHFWLQPQLFEKMQEHKENTHVNVDFEEQQTQMMTGDWEDEDADLIEVIPNKG